MKDSIFKGLRHPVSNGESVETRGIAVADGYKPDITVTDDSNSVVYILESEQKTDRKAFLGDVIKAEMYAEQNKIRPKLIIVMREFKNTTTQQIAEHLKPYAVWLEQKNEGTLNLSGIQVLSDSEYEEAISARETMGSAEFKDRGHIVI